MRESFDIIIYVRNYIFIQFVSRYCDSQLSPSVKMKMVIIHYLLKLHSFQPSGLTPNTMMYIIQSLSKFQVGKNYCHTSSSNCSLSLYGFYLKYPASYDIKLQSVSYKINLLPAHTVARICVS